ncbi:MAG: nucleotide exchange factor GrpE [Acidimicrobiia bacterium]
MTERSDDAPPAETAAAEEGPVVVDAEIIEEPPVEPARLDIELPEDREQAIQLLLQDLAEARRAADAYLEDLQRLGAAFENFRKRTERDRTEVIERASQRIVEKIFPVLDTFDQAFTHQAQTPAEEQLLAGMRGTYHQLMDVLAKEGLEAIASEGESFDPAMHEAVSGPPQPGDGALVVVEEVRRGYKLKGRVVRPALVTVDHA